VGKLGFFSIGVTCADLNSVGNVPVLNEMFASSAINGDRVSESLLSNHVGMTSSAEDLSAVSDRRRVSSSAVPGVSVFS